MNKATIIVPCAGKSSRYPTVRPKFLLVNPNGNLMLIDAISKINLKNCDIVVTILKEHNEIYRIESMIKKFLPTLNIKLYVLSSSTRSQAETVYKTLKKEKIEGPFLVKDCDNIFRLKKVIEDYNYVATLNLKNAGLTNAANKSYAASNEKGFIEKIREKEVISDTFCVGGYYFTKSRDFVEAFETLNKENAQTELYVSMIIRFLIEKKGVQFRIKNISEYLDLGTINEWLHYKSSVRTYFIDIDGVLVENSGEYSEPIWGTTNGIEENVRVIQKLYNQGNQIILLTSRRKSFKNVTINQLKRVGVSYHQLVMGIYHSQRVIINDFSTSNPYPSALAINIPRDSNELIKYLNLQKEWPLGEGGGT